ncbi:SDR family NAD(P)-dependent oxidoreductase [Sphingomonas sp.]|uniref:SDR family NAD(P)-dependent oxidoreductase n=1 Tax=Sphingomonas sp. TaxID=28214 RepID=UPI003D6D2B8C
MTGKAVLVTGGAAGIGKAIVERFSAEGASVMIADIDATAAATLATSLGAASIGMDVADEISVAAAIRECVERYGRLDVLINNAGIGAPKALLHETSSEVWRKVVTIDLEGVFLCMKHGIAQMLAQGDGGTIINTASVSGMVGQKFFAPYGAAKAGVIALTRTAALEYGSHNIRVCAVSPTAVMTALVQKLKDASTDPDTFQSHLETFNPLPGMAQPDDVAAAMLFLASADARFVSGVILPVDGGYTAR